MDSEGSNRFPHLKKKLDFEDRLKLEKDYYSLSCPLRRSAWLKEELSKWLKSPEGVDFKRKERWRHKLESVSERILPSHCSLCRQRCSQCCQRCSGMVIWSIVISVNGVSPDKNQ
jgi:hypothetical protein